MDNSLAANQDLFQKIPPHYLRTAHAQATPIFEELPILSKKEYDQIYDKNVLIYGYCERNLLKIAASAPATHLQLAIVNSNGCIIRSFKGKSSSPLLSPRRCWTLDTMGPNAVTVGLKENRRFYSIGKENYHTGLHDSAVFFTPFRIRGALEPFEDTDYGGLILLAPADADVRLLCLFLSAIAYDLAMTIHFNQFTHMLYSKSANEVLSIDTAMSPGQATIVGYSQGLFDLLGVQPSSLRFHPLEELLDPPPANSELYRIIQKKQIINQRHICVRVGGNCVNCIISSDRFDQPSVNAGGVILYLNTQKRINADISEKTANNALLSFDDVIGNSSCICSTVRRARLLSRSASSILILGESGVGKDVFAQAIHNASNRRGKPYIAVNCGALPRELIASELFGYEGGAFTGAKRQGNIGKFELANGGTIFLDEIGELPLDLQATLLRIVEEKKFTRLGSSNVIDIDVKIISATNADLSAMVAQKRFRADLFYRLSTLRLQIPPLRARGKDAILLAEQFISAISSRIGKAPMELSAAAKEFLCSFSWPGNVRQLQNAMENIVQLYDIPVITPAMIQEAIGPMTSEADLALYAYTAPPDGSGGVRRGKYHFSREDILQALARCGENRTQAAQYLGISRKTLYRNMERLGL